MTSTPPSQPSDTLPDDPQAGALLLVPLDQGRFGGVHVLSVDATRAQLAVLDTIWDCRPAPDAVAGAMPAMQVRVPIARLSGTLSAGTSRPVTTLKSTALVDAPLTALIAGLITTAL